MIFHRKGYPPYPADIKPLVLPNDKLLVYRLEGVTDNNLDIWRQLPQPFFADQGLLYYNFEFTQDGYTLLVEPEFDANLVPADLIQKQVFRILVVPTDLGTIAKVDTANLNAVMNGLGISEKDIRNGSN